MNIKHQEIISKYSGKKGILIPLMQEIQNEDGYLSREAIENISSQTGIAIAEIYGVATFYSMFRLKPQGKYTIRICKGTACHVSGVKTILETLRETLKLTGDEDTTEDNQFTLLEVACLGCCSLAPVIMIEDKTYGKLTDAKIPKVIESFIKGVS
ncbi:MAG: NADH-quinone oxidoreductase subunit E [Candidatus Cloacimonetes bacterium 4572_65]|nr:MAG: NADH-quinone oxidoreductase subunit E [Candidatus Cloacimonetes bacterium 4572_65]